MESENINREPGVQAMNAGKNILLKLKKNPSDIAFIRSLGFARWDSAGFCWVVHNNPANQKKITDYFASR
jgi:hypothetical protein